MLITFMIRDANSEMRLLPMLRNSAAPALYSASIGYDSAESQKYVSAACITSGSTLPNTSRRMCRLSTSTSAPMATAMPKVAYTSCLAERQAFSLSRRPRYWLATTAPPVASAANI